MTARKAGAAKRAKNAVKRDVRAVKKVKARFDEIFERIAFVVGVLGFAALMALGIWLVWREIAPASAPRFLSRPQITAGLAISVFAASFLGWLVVNDGQSRLEQKTGRMLSVLLFGLLPLMCLISTVFPSWVAKTFGLPAMDAQPWHVFWVIVRFYPLTLIAACLGYAFMREAKPRDHLRKKRALKFLLLTAPYVIVLVFQELSLKNKLLEDSIGAALGAAGVNAQLILALMTGSRFS